MEQEGELRRFTRHQRGRWLNNLVEQDHRRVKRRTGPMLGFGSFRTARRALAGVEVMAMLAKGQVRVGPADDMPAQRAFAFDAGQHGKAFQRLRQRAGLRGVVERPRFIQAVGHGQRFRMIGDRDVFEPAFARRTRHGLERLAPVRLGRVHVEIAAQVARLDEGRQRAGGRGLQLAAVFTQLGRQSTPARAPGKCFLPWRRRSTDPADRRGRTR